MHKLRGGWRCLARTWPTGWIAPTSPRCVIGPSVGLELMLGLRRHCCVLSFGWLPGPCWRELVNSNDLQEESCSRTRPLSCCRPGPRCRRAARVVGAVGVETPWRFRPLSSRLVDATAALSRRRPPTPRPPAATVATVAPAAPSPPDPLAEGGGTRPPPPPPP